MSEEDKHKLSKILYYSDIHPADAEFINNIIYDLQQENKQLKEDKRKAIEYNKNILKENWYGGNEKEYAKKNLEILGDKE